MTTVFSTIQAHAKRAFGVISTALQPPRAARTFTLRELLAALEGARNRTDIAPPHLTRLLSVVRGDLAVAVRNPERRGGPDTVRPLRDWRSRYKRLDRYLLRG